MARMTKAQKKRKVRDIVQKTRSLYNSWAGSGNVDYIISTRDMEAIEKLTRKWFKRIG